MEMKLKTSKRNTRKNESNPSYPNKKKMITDGLEFIEKMWGFFYLIIERHNFNRFGSTFLNILKEFKKTHKKEQIGSCTDLCTPAHLCKQKYTRSYSTRTSHSHTGTYKKKTILHTHTRACTYTYVRIHALDVI